MNKTKTHKNGGFPPIKYCPMTNKINIADSKATKERFFSNAPRQNINIRQLLSENQKKPVIITDEAKEDDLEVLDSL